MAFIVTLIFVTLSIAASAAFFSIYGLAHVFAGAFWPVVVMASSLEAGKLVAASFVYRYWTTISFLMKSYLITAIIVLMVVTSAGIFGYLSAAYQEDVMPLKQKEQQIQLLTEEKQELEKLKAERLERRKQIDADIASLPNNYITGRQRLMKSYGPELENIRDDIQQYTEQIREKTLKISQLRSDTLEAEAHVGPIIFIAKVFDRDIDDTTKWLILIIIFAFDPLAVILTIGANIALVQRRKDLGLDELAKKKKQAKLDAIDHEHADADSDEIDFEEPDPTITSPDDIVFDHNDEDPGEQKENDEESDNVAGSAGGNIEQLQKMLMEMQEKQAERELTPEELEQKERIERLLRRDDVVRRIRNPEKVLERQPNPND